MAGVDGFCFSIGRERYSRAIDWLAGKWSNPQEVLDNVRVVEHIKDG